MTTYTNGFPFDANSRLMVTDIGASAVPATAVFNQGFAFNQSDGSLYVTTQNPASDKISNAGFLQRNDGALFVKNGAVSSQYYIEGLAVDSSGVLFTSSVGTIDHYSSGFPVTSADRTVTS